MTLGRIEPIDSVLPVFQKRHAHHGFLIYEYRTDETSVYGLERLPMSHGSSCMTCNAMSSNRRRLRHVLSLPWAFGKDSGNNMKTRICLFSLAAVLLLGTSTFADGPFDKFLPRGRLLKKLRDDIMGEPAPKQPTPAAKPNQAAKKGPTPATRPPAQLRSQPSQNVNADRPAAVRSGADGFGMAIVVDKNENLVVAQVSANGNAAEAGIRRGDVLVEAGGVELTSIEEFEEIEKILGAGDQVELKVARNGRAAKVMLQHGQAPSLEDVENGKVGAQANTASRSQGYQPSSSSREDFSFVPPSDENGSSSMRSVIDRPTAPVRPASTQKPALSQLQSNYRPQAPRPRQQSASAQQQQEIQLLRRQLEQLRRQQSLIGSGVQPR